MDFGGVLSFQLHTPTSDRQNPDPVFQAAHSVLFAHGHLQF